MNDLIIRYDETGKIDHSRSRELILNTFFDDIWQKKGSK